MFQAKVILDSIGPNGKRLISVEATYPRFIHSEVMTHRDRERNSASSRAIPWERFMTDEAAEQFGTGRLVRLSGKYLHPKCMKSMIMMTPVIPISFDGEQKGMQSAGPVARQGDARLIWLAARDDAVAWAQALADLGVHKSICNRLTEPFMWITTLMTSTEWKNFFRLRCHPAAEKHFEKIACMIRDAIAASTPVARYRHTPYIDDEEAIRDYVIERCKTPGTREERFVWGFDGSRNAAIDNMVDSITAEVSSARCARLSYLTHGGERSITKDLALFDKLIRRDDDVLHASPLGHVGFASSREDLRSGPFVGWFQFRKSFANENVPG